MKVVSGLGLVPNTAKSRLSIAFVRAICAQAGCPVTEPSPDEDVHRIDLTLNAPAADIPIQVKATESAILTRHGYRLDLKPDWVESWKRRRLVPVHVVLVVVGKVQDQWVSHPASDTRMDAVAYWQRFDPASHVRSMHLPVANRLTADSLSRLVSQVEYEQFGGA